MGKHGWGKEGRNCLVISREDRDHKWAASALARFSHQEISPGWGGGRCWQEGQGLPQPLPWALGKWSLCSVSGSGLLSCQDPGFPALARSFPFDSK